MAGNHSSTPEDETLTGSTGVDTFFFGPGDGADTVTDFTTGEDLIDLRQFPNISSFSDLTVTSTSEGVTIDLTAHGGGTIFLQGVTTISASDFVFPIVGTDSDDNLAGDAENNTIYGGDGEDTIRGGEGHDSLYGDAGNDTIYGEAGNDTLRGGEGDDTLYGGDGESYDRLYGGDDNDTLYGGEGDDDLYGEAGDDTLRGGEGHDSLYGGAGNDMLYGGGGEDLLEGGEGDDILYGGEGDDDLYGGANNDTLYGGAGRDNLYGGEGDDTLHGGTEADRLDGGEGDDTIHGGEGRDIIDGGADDDVLYGGEGNDNIWGGSGSDVIDGGKGNDNLTGDNYIGPRSGSVDTFVFQADHGNDNIEMFKVGEDKIDLTAFTDITSFDDLTITSSAQGVVIDLTQYGGGTITFKTNSTEYSVESGDLSASDFLLYQNEYAGTDGDDTLTGGEGDDTLTGGEGDDTFVFGTDHGTDTITDFTNGEDMIDLTRISGITGFDDLSISADGTTAVIDLTAHSGGTIRVENVDVADLDAGDFSFFEAPVDGM
jgi:Ca2+-binding RTX toxin-like protein